MFSEMVVALQPQVWHNGHQASVLCLEREVTTSGREGGAEDGIPRWLVLFYCEGNHHLLNEQHAVLKKT